VHEETGAGVHWRLSTGLKLPHRTLTGLRIRERAAAVHEEAAAGAVLESTAASRSDPLWERIRSESRSVTRSALDRL